MFEAKLTQEDHHYRNKIIRFLVDQADQMEKTLEVMRTLVDNMVPDISPPNEEKNTQTSLHPGTSTDPER